MSIHSIPPVPMRLESLSENLLRTKPDMFSFKWKFSGQTSMVCKVKAILELQKGQKGAMKVV